MHRFVIVGLLSLALAAAAGAAAAEAPSPIKTAELSARLYAAGIAVRAPVLVLAAAKLRKEIAPTPGGRAADGAGPATGAGAPLDWEAMLDTAAGFATGDDAMLGLIEDARVEGMKGVVKGPIYSNGEVAGGMTDVYSGVGFKGGEYAEVYVEGKGRSDLNLFVFDAAGRLVCSDTDISDIAYCGWRPATGGDFEIKVENRGKQANAYALMSN